MLHAGIRWGGNECRYQALAAKSELGLLRDMRFILVELKFGSSAKRLIAIACLSFLQTGQSNKRLYYILQNDYINNVRYSAMWSLAFMQGTSLLEDIGKLAKRDNDKNVRELGETITKSKAEKLWLL